MKGDRNTAVRWLCESGDFVYPRQANVKDEDYLNYVCSKLLDTTDMVDSILSGDFSACFDEHPEYRKAMMGVLVALADNPEIKSVKQIESEKRAKYLYDYIMSAKKFCSNAVKYNKLHDSLLSDTVYEICHKYADGGTEQVKGQICMLFGSSEKELASQMFTEFQDSDEFAELINLKMDDISVATDILEVAKYCYDALLT